MSVIAILLNKRFLIINRFLKLGYFSATNDRASAQCITMPWQWVLWRLKSPAAGLFAQPFLQVRIKKHQSSPSLACVMGIHRWPVDSPHKRPVKRKMFPFGDVIMDCPGASKAALSDMDKISVMWSQMIHLSAVWSDQQQRNHQSSALLALFSGNLPAAGGVPA